MEARMMRRTRRTLGGLLLTGLLLLPAWGAAQSWSSGSTGAQGAFPPTGADAPPTGTTQYSLYLSNGRLYYYSGSWTYVTLPNTPADGFRDGILNFTTFNVPSGVTMYVSRNATNTPVTILTTGGATVSGTISLNGGNAQPYGRPGTGAPGGFDGAAGGDGLTTNTGGTGLGPGGGGGAAGNYGIGGAGGFGSAGAASGCSGYPLGAAGASYGSALLRPVVGGSGGGGGGGGGILIASSTSITVNSGAAIRADGGAGGTGLYGGGGGSGGGIRVVAPTITMVGTLSAQGGYGGQCAGTGGNGRIRMEANTLNYSGSSTPLATTSLPQPVSPSSGQPALAITSIGGLSVPANPVGTMLGAPDILLPVGTTNPVTVGLTASNVPLGSTVQVSAAPQNAAKTSATCALLDGSQANSTCAASLSISLTQMNVLTASVTFPLVASAGEGLLYAEGEEVKWVRVASTLGGPSTVTYITASGKEVAATALASRVP